MSSENPFKVLGLSSSLIKKLNDEQIKYLVKMQYRALQFIFHPDKYRGSSERSKEISEAYAQLNEPSNYKFFKENFLKFKRGEKQVKELKEQNAELEKELQKNYSAFYNYIKEASLLENITTVFNLNSCTLKMGDITDSFNYNLYQREVAKLPKSFYDLNVDSNQSLSKKQEDKIVYLPNKKLIGLISSEKTNSFGGIKHLLRVIQGFWTEEDENMRKRIFKLLTSPRSISPYSKKIDSDRFLPFMYLLSPKIEPKNKDYLFSINMDQNKTYIECDGAILDIV
ncbi:hypothetical protein J4403_01920 [Candidatus Woesearchaeota archaeon]|nr:hypothetical protein [Candidatus Woesearchaeota archaeon]